MKPISTHSEDSVSTDQADFKQVLEAAQRIAPMIRHTDIVTSERLNQQWNCQLAMKCEQQQATGAFKLRGASNAIVRLRERGLDGDVATHSSGNHGAALAWAAREGGRTAHVVMPANSVPEKVQQVRHFGGHVIECAPNQQARERGLQALVEQGLHPIPPYDHADIIAGQGTAAVEFLHDRPELDVLLVPVGGGGLLAGTALAARGTKPDMEVIGAEPEGAADTAASFQSGNRVNAWQPDTVADGLRALVGQRNFAIIRDQVDDVLVASDKEIIAAMRLLFKATGMAVEPSAAVGLAVIGRYPERFAGRHVGVILTGSNYDPRLFPWLNQDHAT